MESRRQPTKLPFVDRLPDPFWVITAGSSSKPNKHSPLEALGADDDHSHSTTKWIGSGVPASGFDSPFNPLAARGKDSLAFEDDQRHLRGMVLGVITTYSGYR